MAIQNPNTWEVLYNGLATNEKNKPGGEAVLKRLDELHALAQHGSTEDFQRNVGELLQTYGENYGLSSDINGQDILREALAWKDANFPLTTQQPEQPAQQTTATVSPFAQILQNLHGDNTGGGGGNQTGDIATPALHELQEEELLHAFDQALQVQNDAAHPTAREDAIDNVLNQLGSEALFKNQVNILQNEILNTRAGKNKTREQIVEELTKKANARSEKITTADNDPKNKEQTDKRNERMAQLQQAFDAARKSYDPNNQEKGGALRSAFRNLAQQKIAETTRQYYVLEGFGGEDNTQLANLIFKSIAEERERRRTLLNQFAQQASAQQQQQRQQQQQPNGLQKIAQKAIGQKINPFTKQGLQGLRKGLGQAAKTAIKEGGKTLVKILFGPPYYIGWWIVGAIVLLGVIAAIVVAIIIFITNNQQNQKSTTVPIPGLTLGLTTNPPGKVSYANGQNIQFTIDVTYAGPYSIVITDQEPGNANVIPSSVTGRFNESNNAVVWNLDANTPLADSTPTSKHYRFNLTFTHVGTDLVFHNVVTATYAVGSGPQATITPGTKPQAGGYCSPDQLAKYFGTQQEAATASCICKYESGGDPGVVNKACLQGKGSYWAVGLFQINLDTNPQPCLGAFSRVGNTCTVADLRTLNRCTASLTDPTNNITTAARLYKDAGNSWSKNWPAEKGKCY